MKIREEMGLSFDDVLLVPRKSNIKSRTDGSIYLSVQLTPNIKLQYPLISAAMDTIASFNMIAAMDTLGGLGIIHRFQELEEYLDVLSMLEPPDFYKVATIGLGQKGIDRVKALIGHQIIVDALHIDVAYAHTNAMEDFIPQIRKIYDEGIYKKYKSEKTVKLNPVDIIVGSVATYGGVFSLCCAGADAIRVGVGCGSKCSTRIQTGNGVPQITALMEARQAVEAFKDHSNKRVSIICDGGVKDGGDVMKALAAGADAVMSGYLFAGTDETPGEVVEKDGKKFKCYRGMSSMPAQKAWKRGEKVVSVEGVSSMVECKGPVSEVFNGLVGNMLSGMAYQGARTLKELRQNAEFIKITPAGMAESKPRL